MPRPERQAKQVGGVTLDEEAALGRLSITLTQGNAKDSTSDDVDTVRRTADAATDGLQRLTAAVNACNLAPSSAALRHVEDCAAAVRLELIKLRSFCAGAPGKDAKSTIAFNQLETLSKKYVSELGRLSAGDASDSRPVTAPGIQELDVDQAGYIQVSQDTLEARQQLQDVQDRNREIREVEAGVARIHGLIQEFQILVVNQGEAIDAVETNIENTLGETAKAYVKVSKAKKLKDMIRRKKVMVGLVVAVIVVVGVIVVIVLVA